MRVFIENQAGSRAKNLYDQHTLAYLGTTRVSLPYPFPYGFVIGTRSEDGDGVDCFVLTAAELASGTSIECLPVGLLEQVEDGEVDHKVLAVPAGEALTVDHTIVEALHDFVRGVFAHVPGKTIEIGRLLGRPEAEAYVRACRDEAQPGGSQGD